MSAQIVFLTLFLGIVSGTQQVALQVSGPVKVVRLMLDGRQAAVITAPPWRVTVELGSELTPRELAAVGFDARGQEIARVRQILNLPRPTAEFDIVVERNDASLQWRHLMNVKPERAKLTLDGKPLVVDGRLHARLPKLDIEVPHVIAAELRFADGFVARRELVIESVRSDSVGTELTPVLVRETAQAHPATWDRCLATASGKVVRTAAVEKPRALVIVVRDPDPREVQFALDPSGRVRSARQHEALRHLVPLDRDTMQRMIWAVPERYATGDGMASVLFPPSTDVDASTAGIIWFLQTRGAVDMNAPRQFADAVAVAGVRAVTGAQRRAVVLLLSSNADASKNQPAAVRRYLQSIGVPLFVWSVTGPRPDVAGTWGEVGDVSSLTKLTEAVARLRRTLDEQRIAWVDVDPLAALRLKADESCGIAMVARATP